MKNLMHSNGERSTGSVEFKSAGGISALLQVARQYADAHHNGAGVAATPVDGVFILRETSPTALQFAITKPLVALVLQGSKRVTMGNNSYDFSAGESLLVTMDVPTVSQVTAASADAPYYSLVVELDTAVISELLENMGGPEAVANFPVRIDQIEDDVAEAALRLLKMLSRPRALHVLGGQLLRELHYWLMSGRHGRAVRAMGSSDSYARRITRAVRILRADYVKPLRIKSLADAAGMSLSVFHTHFRQVTTLTPLQFQKQLRLLEARRLMLTEGTSITIAAHTVGYESVTQFTREYARMFGSPPARNIREVRALERPAIAGEPAGHG